MKLLKKLLGFNKPTGARLEGPAWEFSVPKDIPDFIRAIPTLSNNAFLFLETSSSSRAIAKVLKEISVVPELDIAKGIIWPKPISYHVPVFPDTIETVAALFDNHIPFEVCCHFHVYSKGKIVLEWHDAFSNEPFLVSKDVSQDRANSFARGIGCSIAEASLSG